jgi:hypothetical protein
VAWQIAALGRKTTAAVRFDVAGLALARVAVGERE